MGPVRAAWPFFGAFLKPVALPAVADCPLARGAGCRLRWRAWVRAKRRETRPASRTRRQHGGWRGRWWWPWRPWWRPWPRSRRKPGGRGSPATNCITCSTASGWLTAFRQQGLGFFAPANIERNFPWRPGGPPVHPPLGNLALASVHHLFDLAPNNPRSVSILPARFAPALALGALVLVVGFWITRAEGPVAGYAAAAAVVLVPRVFGHAHLAALDTITALFFVAAVLAVAEADARGGRLWHFALAGVVWGLAMLVRIHGLLARAGRWSCGLAWRLRRRITVPLVAWGAAGMATLFVGWPWLWLAPIAHFRQFLGTATGRQPIHVFYAGRVWADHETPWHYPVVMFVVALPLGLLLLGLLGAWARRRRWPGRSGLLAGDGLALGHAAGLLLAGHARLRRREALL